MVQIHSFPKEYNYIFTNILYVLITYILYILLVFLKEYSLIGKIGSFKLQISSSSLDALVVIWYFIYIDNIYIYFMFIA